MSASPGGLGSLWSRQTLGEPRGDELDRDGVEMVAAGCAMGGDRGAAVGDEVLPGALLQLARDDVVLLPWTSRTGTPSSRAGVVGGPASKGSVPWRSTAPA